MTPDEPRTRRATAIGLMLLISVAAALLMAWLLTATIGRSYITFLMPALVGWVVGAAVSLVALGFRVSEKAPTLAAAILGAAIAYGGFHVWSFAETVDGLAEHAAVAAGPGADGTPAEPDADEIVRLMEIDTARDGFWAYIAFTSEPARSQLSPLGVLARGGITYGMATLFMAIEALLCVGAAGLLALFRTRKLRVDPPAAPEARA